MDGTGLPTAVLPELPPRRGLLVVRLAGYPQPVARKVALAASAKAGGELRSGGWVDDAHGCGVGGLGDGFPGQAHGPATTGAANEEDAMTTASRMALQGPEAELGSVVAADLTRL